MTSNGEPEPVELLVASGGEQPEVDAIDAVDERVAVAPLWSTWWVRAIALAASVGFVAMLWVGGSDRSDPSGDAAPPVVDDGSGEVAAPGGSPPVGPGDAARVFQHRLQDLDDPIFLVIASPIGITVWDLVGGQTSLVPLPEAPAGDGLVPVADRLVYVGSTSAWSIDADGNARSLGPADQVLAAGSPSLVWLGTETDADPHVRYVDWSEVTADGVEQRRTRREMPLEFQTPDLVWGFDSSLFRLTEDVDRPWRLIAYGAPLAVGPNDLIVKACDPDCSRQWFDAVTGDDRGSLLADVSSSFDGQRGWLSPDGRFIASQRGANAAVEVLSLGLGETTDVDCESAREVVWSALGFLVCATPSGISVVDLETGGSISVVPPIDVYGFALWAPG